MRFQLRKIQRWNSIREPHQLLFLAGLFIHILFSHTAMGQVSVIAHGSVPVDTLDKKELLQIFNGTQDHWKDGRPVVIMDLSVNGTIRESFYAYLGKTSSRMRSIWLKRKLTGEGELPQSINSEQELIEKVASTQGAIGFISTELTKDLSQVKVLISQIPLIKDN